MKYIAQTLAYGVFAAVVGLLSVWPGYELLGDEQAMISLTFSHAGRRLEQCRRLTQEELNELPPNMRKPSACPRERYPITVQFRVNGTVVYEETEPPSGLWSDGKSTVYRRLKTDAGEHALYIGMNESGRDDGFDFELRTVRDISPGQNLVIDFDEVQQTFVVR
ncbi:MAG: hypothetical protein ACE5OQ_16635 [Woeseia sp.]